jgi:hypothetical protein
MLKEHFGTLEVVFTTSRGGPDNVTFLVCHSAQGCSTAGVLPKLFISVQISFILLILSHCFIEQSIPEKDYSFLSTNSKNSEQINTTITTKITQ